MDDIPKKKKIKPLSPKQAVFVAEYLKSGGKGQDSAIAAGFSAKNAHNTAVRLKRNPAVAQALAAARKEIVDLGIYGVKEAMERAEGARLRAIENKQGNAEVKSIELQAKLMGILSENLIVAPSGFTLQINQLPVKPEPTSITVEVSNPPTQIDHVTSMKEEEGEEDVL